MSDVQFPGGLNRDQRSIRRGKRRWVVAAVVAIATAALATITSPRDEAQAQNPDYTVYFGYADGNTRGLGSLPKPWRDDPNVNFIGKDDTNCCVAETDDPGWDGGAVRVQNHTSQPMTVYIEVTNMALCNRDWPTTKIGPGEDLIVTNTRNEGPESGNADFWDTSDTEWLCQGVAFGSDNCDYKPTGTIKVTVNGVTSSYTDSNHVLLAKGKDSTCHGVTTVGYEFVPWEAIPCGSTCAPGAPSTPTTPPTSPTTVTPPTTAVPTTIATTTTVALPTPITVLVKPTTTTAKPIKPATIDPLPTPPTFVVASTTTPPTTTPATTTTPPTTVVPKSTTTVPTRSTPAVPAPTTTAAPTTTIPPAPTTTLEAPTTVALAPTTVVPVIPTVAPNVGVSTTEGTMGTATWCARMDGDSQSWHQYVKGAVYVDVDTSRCGFSAAPRYFTSLRGTNTNTGIDGVSSIYFPTSTGFRVYLRSPWITPQRATTRGWTIDWFATTGSTTDLCSGVTPSSGWNTYTQSTVWRDVDTSSCPATSTPKYFSSLNGTTQHWLARGATSIYLPTATGFRVYLHVPGGITPDETTDRGYSINWLAATQMATSMSGLGTICSNATTPGETDWTVSRRGASISTDLSSCGADDESTITLTSLGGDDNHWVASNITSVEQHDGSVRRVHVRTRRTPADVNERRWHLNQLRIPTASPATDGTRSDEKFDTTVRIGAPAG